ncbi:MAG: hypothetical protein RRE78_10170 [Acidianus sp.]|jgi:hypothetical protein|nr:hypothetical protein [Acidianus sp.]
MRICIKRDLSITFEEKECVKVVELEENDGKLKVGEVEYLKG